MRELTRLRRQTGIWEEMRQRLEDTLILAEMSDPDLAAELEQETDALTKTVERLEFQAL